MKAHTIDRILKGVLIFLGVCALLILVTVGRCAHAGFVAMAAQEKARAEAVTKANYRLTEWNGHYWVEQKYEGGLAHYPECPKCRPAATLSPRASSEGRETK